MSDTEEEGGDKMAYGLVGIDQDSVEIGEGWCKPKIVYSGDGEKLGWCKTGLWQNWAAAKLGCGKTVLRQH